jgi:hypothetical protein
MADNSDELVDDPPVRLFGDPRSALVQRGPERRHDQVITAASPDLTSLSMKSRQIDPGHALRSGRGDGFAAVLMVLGIMVFVATVITSTLILYNAKNVGAFSNPWDSTRVAIGLAVLAVGLVQSVILIGLSRVTSYLLAILRLRQQDLARGGD